MEKKNDCHWSQKYLNRSVPVHSEGMTMDLKSDESIYCLRCFTHLRVYVCDLSASSVSHCFRLFVFTLSYIPTCLFTNRNHGNMSVLICSPDSICHHQSSTASSLHLERKRDGNQRRRTQQWGFQQKTLHQSNGASCVIKNSKATVGDGMQMICSS